MPSDKPFHIQVVGRGQRRGQFLIVSKRDLVFEALPGTRCVVEKKARDELAEMLKEIDSQKFAETHGLSTSTVHRIRQALGVANEYEGKSRTTRWRKRKAGE